MLCKSYIRSVIVQAGNIVTSTKARVHFNNTDRICVLANSWNRAFRSSLRMMVDTGAMDEQGSVFDVLPDKDEDGEYTSGGCKSEGGELSCGYSSFRGKRATMEDFYDVKMSKIDGQTVCLFGIFDGHGGSRAAQYLKEHLFENLMKHPQFMTDTKLAISASKFLYT